jgi:hypothetical protein
VSADGMAAAAGQGWSLTSFIPNTEHNSITFLKALCCRLKPTGLQACAAAELSTAFI